ncbi:TPM domain-containing protein [Candidatus Eisenbacteria bacterium]|uniref:TPM domain-containing protein n=1 Tax=Eiseniibacteriota bacterium TaxID=2212470 RepID=A0ABV6YI37_UNCEI
MRKNSNKMLPRRGLLLVRHSPLLALLLLACLALTSWGLQDAAAQSRRGQRLILGDLQIPAPTGYVNDLAGSLTPPQRSELENLCRQIDRATGAQIALVIVRNLAGEDITDVRTRLFEVWRVGRKKDDRGLLMLHDLETRRIEVEIGYGLEGILPDSRIGVILDESVIPHFGQDRFFEGYRAGLMSFASWINQDPDSRAGSDAYQRGTSGSKERRRGFPLMTILFIPIFLYLLIRHPRLLFLMMIMGMGRRGGFGGGHGGGFGGGFGGFGGGMSGGGGAGRSY